jgi:eukaryotic-like serine/threonine-protein kinase
MPVRPLSPDDDTSAISGDSSSFPTDPGDATLHVDPDATIFTHPEAESPPPAPILRINRYEIQRELGRGGMGVVYLAHDVDLKRPVAFKVLPKGFAGSAQARARFRREAETASRLSHPNLCGVFGVGEESECDWIAMRYVPGRTLAEEIAAARASGQRTWRNTAAELGDRPAWHDSVRLIETIARALHAAHDAGIVHRDLKPSNVMIDPAGVPVVLDFGLAHDLSEDSPTLTHSGDVLGTPHYMAPEQIQGQARHADRTTDVWALGVMLYEVLTLARPFDGATRDSLYRDILQREPVKLRKANRGLPRDLDVVVATALEKDPARRYSSALALADDLRAVLEIRPIHARPPTIAVRAIKFARRRPAVALFIATLAIVLPTLTILWTSARSERRRATRAALGQVLDAAAALDDRNLGRAERALGKARELGAASGDVAEIERRLARLAELERLETLCLDRDSDPDGRLALAYIDSLDRAGAPALTAAAWRAYVLLRTRRADAAAEVLDRLEAREPGRGAALVRAALLPAASESRPASGPASRPALSEAASGELAHPGAGQIGDLSLDLLEVLGESARGRHRAALLRLQRLLARSPQAHWLAWAAAEESTELQEYQAALAFAARHRARVERLGPERRARYSVHLRRAGLGEEALVDARAAAAAAPEAPTCELHLAMALNEVGRNDEALARATALAGRAPDMVEAWMALGVMRFDREDYAGSKEAYVRATELDPNRVEAWLGIGNSECEIGRNEDAERALVRALAVQPDAPYVLNTLATVQRRLGRLADARRTVERCLELRPNYPEAIAGLASILHSEGKIELAVRKYREALALNPDIAAAMFNLALIVRDQDPRQAVDLFRRVAALEKRNDAARLNLAHTLSGLGELAEAHRWIREACAIRPGEPMNWNNLGTVLSELGRKDEAVEAFRHTVAVDPKFWTGHANVMLMVQDVDPLEALARALEVQRINPDFFAQIEGNVQAQLARLAERKERHPLVTAARMQRDLDADPEDKAEVLAEALAALPSLRDGAPGSRDFHLKRALLQQATLLAIALGDESAAQVIAPVVKRLDSLPASAGSAPVVD